MRLKSLLEVGELGALPIAGIGLAAVVAPYLIPALRSRAGEIVKASAKLFFESEFEAEGLLAELLAAATVDALMGVPLHKSTEERRQQTDRVLDRFFSKAHAGARRRGFDDEDKRNRYHKHLTAIERRLKQKQEGAGAEHAPLFTHALQRITTERHAHRKASAKVGTAPASRANLRPGPG